MFPNGAAPNPKGPFSNVSLTLIFSLNFSLFRPDYRKADASDPTDAQHFTLCKLSCRDAAFRS
jgi:hypothetical protein